MLRRSRTLASVLVVGTYLVACLLPPSVVAADKVDFGRPTAQSFFPVGTRFQQGFHVAAAPRRVELMTRLEGAETWLVQEVGFSAVGKDGFEVTLTDPTFQLPNSRIRYRFRVTPASGPPETGPEATLSINDDRIEWQTLKGDLVTIHWQSGDVAYAQRALKIAEDAVAKTSEFLGVTETDPIDFFVYSDGDEFRTALGPGTKEFVAGRAIAEIRTLFADVAVSDIGSPWLSIVVPHELVHLVFDTATKNPYNQPPHWMNEGLAVYLSEGYSNADRQRVSNAVDRGTLLPLSALANGFPSAREDLFYLGYAEGTSAIDFFIRTYGQEKLVELIRSYATGETDDEAFTAATGADYGAFEAAWLADLGVSAPRAIGPQAGRPGPTPAGWIGNAAPQAAPGASADGIPSGVLPGEPRPDSSGSAAVGLAALALIAASVLIGGLAVRRRRPRAAAAPADPKEPDGPRGG
jgi:hypothetical protein